MAVMINFMCFEHNLNFLHYFFNSHYCLAHAIRQCGSARILLIKIRDSTESPITGNLQKSVQ